jgi:hypothetical protein
MLRSNRRTGDALIAHVPIHGEVLECAALGLRDKKSGKDTREHKGGEYLHNMVEPRAGVGGGWFTTDTEGRDSALSDDRADLAGCGGDTMRGRTVAGGKALAWHDKGGGIGTPWE